MAHSKKITPRPRPESSGIDVLAGKTFFFVGPGMSFAILRDTLEKNHPEARILRSASVPVRNFTYLTKHMADGALKEIAALPAAPDAVILGTPGIDLDYKDGGFEAVCFPTIQAIHKKGIPSLLIERADAVNCRHMLALGLHGATYTTEPTVPQAMQQLESMMGAQTAHSKG